MPETTPARKKATRPAMKKKSPYKLPVRKTSKVKNLSTAKKLLPTRKFSGKNTTKEEKMQARLRAREWSQRELGQKKNSLHATRAIMTDEDSEDVESKPLANGATFEENNNPYVMYKAKKMSSGLDTTHPSMTQKTANGIGEDRIDEDIFYDALEFLPKKHEVAVEDVSDESDDEISDLRSDRRNRVPSSGQWMEPILMPRPDP